MTEQDRQPTGTVRRDPVRGALAVRVLGGYRVMVPESDHVIVLEDAGGAHDVKVLNWPIIWCPDAAYHEQDNIRRAQGIEPD